MDQRARMTSLDAFRNNQVSLLVCSDVAARGLDIPAVSHVYNFDVPTHAEDYVHRIGRTGRAGRSGTAISIVCRSDQRYVDDIEKLIQKKIDWQGDTLDEVGDGEPEADGTRPSLRDRRPSRRSDPRGGAASAPKARRPEPVAPSTSRFQAEAARSTDHRRHRQDDDDEIVVGLGDHVPSFLLRPVKIKASSEG